MKKSFFGIERKIDFVALTALCISLVNSFIECGHYLSGPDVTLITPEQIVISRNKDAHDTMIFRLSSTMAYINQGPKGQDDIVIKEFVNVKIENSEYDMKWQSFVNSSWKDEKLFYSEEKNVGAFPIDGGGGVHAHETLFYPYVIKENGKISGKNFLVWEDFCKNITVEKEMTFSFRFETKNGKKEKKCCKAILYPNIIQNFLNLGGSPVPCEEVSCEM